MRSVSTYSLRNNLAKYLEEVESNQISLVVKKFNKPLVVISPFCPEDQKKGSDYFGFLGKGEGGKAFLNRVRRSKKENRLINQLRHG